MLYTTQVTHPNGEVKNDNIFREEMAVRYKRQAVIKYPKSAIEVKQVRGVVSCWHCGEPVILTSLHESDYVHQVADKLCCSEGCDVMKTDFPGRNRK